MKSITNLLLLSLFILISSCGTQRSLSTTQDWNYDAFRKQQKSFKSVDGVIKYVDKGAGKVILLLHGVPSSSWLYRKMIDRLVDEGYRVIAPDMLGFGSSANPKGYEVYAPEAHAKRLLALMDALKIDTWSHVMHDAGGLWTWELLKQSPNRVTELVILNTIIYEEGFHPPIRMKRGAFAKFSMWLYKNGITTNMLLKGLFKAGLKENNLTKAELRGYKKPLLEGKVRAMYYFFTKTCNDLPNYDETIENIEIPVAVIWGAEDEMLQWTPQKDKVMRTLGIPSKDVHVIDGKHFIQEEQPLLIDSLVIDFLK